ncbi:MAG TPA: SAVMC3_10250 family protein [Ktedonobacterales bacterium]|nr:SAVMC3_10250 family protein [Ktedonobacterales bacterium]
MAKKKNALKRYVYISQRKLDMFAEQQSGIPVISNLADWFAKVVQIKVLSLEIQRSPSSVHPNKLTSVVKQLEKENTIGTVDHPAEYIKDTLPMFQRLIPSHPEYHRHRGDPGFVYFGGSTSKTIIALVGSPYHLIGHTREITEEPSSDLPYLVEYINLCLKDIAGKKLQASSDNGIEAIKAADQANKDPRIRFEFFAYRILDSADMPDFEPHKRLLLYTPLYVAYASDS